MKVLVVDNGTHYKRRVLSLLNDFEVTWLYYKDIDLEGLSDSFDLVILTGAYKSYSVKNYADTVYAKEQQLIKRTKAPIIGICLGAQLIAKMHGANLSTVADGDKIKGTKTIWELPTSPLKLQDGKARVWASQRWRITDLPSSLAAWCLSDHGVEVFKHASRPIYGIQFHPEHYTRHKDGQKIFHKILRREFGSKIKT